MTWSTLAWVLLAVALTIVATWAFYTARRLDRLHIRLDRSRESLQSALDRRCAVVAATLPQLASAAHATEEIRLTPTDLSSRLERESELSTSIASLIDASPGPGGIGPGPDSIGGGALSASTLAELKDADTRVILALRFYNEAVRDTRALRLRPSVRTLHLGGTAALPEYAALGQLPVANESN